MAFPSFPTIHLHPHNRNQQHPDYRSAGGDGIGGPSGQGPITRPVGSTAGGSSREAKLVGRRPEQEVIKCPRCDSTNTKFCYFNNYSLSQPRHFCKACRRYWTRGGALREVPVGGGRRKNKRRTEKPEGPEPQAAAAAAGGGTAGTSSFKPNYPLTSSIIHQYRSSGLPPTINMPSPANWMDPLPDHSAINIDPNYYEVSATGSPNNNLGFEINNYLKLRQQFPFALAEELLPPPPPAEAFQPLGEPVKIDRDVKAQQLGNSMIIPRHVSNLSRFNRSSADDAFIDWSGSGNSSTGGGGWPAATAGGDFTAMCCFRTPPTDSN